MYFNSLLLVNRGDVDDFSAILKVAEAVGIFRERTNHKQEKKKRSDNTQLIFCLKKFNLERRKRF